MLNRWLALPLFLTSLLVGCGEDSTVMDAAPKDATPDGGQSDMGPKDVGADDSGFPDGGGEDGGREDGGGMDASDAGMTEAVAIQLISISDWHAQLDPLSPTAPSTIAIGGAAALSSFFALERASNPNTIVVTAGDAFGASPPLSSFFDEEPAVLAMNAMGIEVDTFGNHNFDRGIAHLQSMIDLASFTFVSSNLANLNDNLTGVVSPHHIVTVDGVRVGFVGITNPDAPALTEPGAMGTLMVEQIAAAALQAQASAIGDGAQILVALVHVGGAPVGDLQAFADAVTGFDVIFGDHTDQEVNTVINGQRVVENRSKGRTYARVRLTFDGSGPAQVESSEIITAYVDQVAPDPAIEQLLAPYRTQLSMQLDDPIAIATGIFPRGGGIERVGEVAIGNLVADALRETYGTQIAFLNSGGIRDLLPSTYLPADTNLRRTSPGYAAGPPYDIVTGDAYAVFPFANTAVTRTVTGALLHEVLEHSVSAIPAPNGRFLQISGFRFTYTASAAAGLRVSSVELEDGTPILPDNTSYTAATLDFINNGGDGYTVLGGVGTTRELDAAVLAAYLAGEGTIVPTIEGRITRVFGVPNPTCDPTPRAPRPGDLIINEILFDPGPTLADGDANLDGVRDGTADEFVELVNLSTATLDLSGVMIDDAIQNRHLFVAGSTLSCGSPIVVFGGGDPLHPNWQPTWIVASDGMLGLNNTTDTVSVLDAAGVALTQVTYPDLASEEDEAIVRETELDPNAAFIEHSAHPQAAGAFFSPGTRVDGSSF